MRVECTLYVKPDINTVHLLTLKTYLQSYIEPKYTKFYFKQSAYMIN